LREWCPRSSFMHKPSAWSGDALGTDFGVSASGYHFNVHPCVTENPTCRKMIGTLTSTILKPMYTIISPISFYKLYSVATPGHSEPLLLLYHLRIVVLAPDLQRVSFYSVIKFLYHSSTIKLLLLLIRIKWLYLCFQALVLF
jgi:hypothetical protein